MNFKVPKKQSQLLLACIVFIVMLVLTSGAYAEVVFVANKTVPIEQVSAREIRDIFIGEQVKWKNGKRIVLVVLMGTDIHKEFTKKYTRKTSSQFFTYWRSLIFTGKGVFPMSFDTEEELISFVANTEGAIGYVSSGTKTDNVKTIKVTD